MEHDGDEHHPGRHRCRQARRAAHAPVRHRAQLRRGLDPEELDYAGIKLVNDDVGVRWLYSFLSADKKKTYCLYEAPNPEAIREAAERLGIPADVITPVEQIDPALRL